MKDTILSDDTYTVTLQQQAYISDCGDYYQAHAIDDEERDFRVVWEITHHDTHEWGDESDACDWDDYEIIELF